MCVLKDIVDLKLFLIKKKTWQVLLGDAYAHHINPVLSNSVGKSLVEWLPKSAIFKSL